MLLPKLCNKRMQSTDIWLYSCMNLTDGLEQVIDRTGTLQLLDLSRLKKLRLQHQSTQRFKSLNTLNMIYNYPNPVSLLCGLLLEISLWKLFLYQFMFYIRQLFNYIVLIFSTVFVFPYVKQQLQNNLNVLTFTLFWPNRHRRCRFITILQICIW